MHVALICINYRTPERTIKFVNHLLPGIALGMKIFIVDNSSDENHDALKHWSQSSIHLLNPKTNLGYFGGAQFALDYMDALQTKFDWVIVANNDTELNIVEILGQLRSEKKPNLAVIAPLIFSELSNKSQNPFLTNRPPRWRMHFYKWIFSNYCTCLTYQLLGLAKALVRSKLDRESQAFPSKIYAAHGAFMIFHSAYFLAGGNFKHPAFLFGEEITVAEFCRIHKLDIVFDPNIQIKHEEHATIGRIPSRKIMNYIRESSKVIADLYF
jgi:hypothetical protein